MFKEIFNDILRDLGISTIKRPDNLTCPNCQNSMKKLSIRMKGELLQENLQLDFCQECEGIWFDRGELIKSLEIDIKDISKFFPSRTKQSIKGTGRRICPLCQRQLSLINYSKDSNIWVDICSNGCGIFLDSGELELIKLYSINPSYLSSVASQQEDKYQQDSTTELYTQIRNISQRVEKLKNNLVNKVKEIELAIKARDINKIKSFVAKGLFSEELKEAGIINQEIRNLYQKYGNYKEIEDIQTSLQNVIKFIDIRSNTINERISSEIEKFETISKKESAIDLQKFTTQSPQQTGVKPSGDLSVADTEKQVIEPVKHSVDSDSKNVTKTTAPTYASGNISENTSEILKETKFSQETKKEEIQKTKQEPEKKVMSVSQSQPQFTIEKIKLSGFENLYYYLFINSNLYLLSENKIFVFQENSFQEIKVKELNFRIKKAKVIDERLFIMGSSGNIMELSLNFEFRNLYRVGYSDISDLVNINDKFFALSSNRVYVLDSNFKVVHEKSLNTNFLEALGDNLLGATNNLVLFDKDLNKIQEYNTNSFQQLKKIKFVDDKIFLLGSGVMFLFDLKNLTKLSLPKSYLEVNDIQKIGEHYYICSNSGGFYSTTDFNNYQEIRLNTFDNIYTIMFLNNKIYLGCSNSNVLILSI
ncbi:MAG: zf-TFIIB domain-containing protein [Candidatus Calescibacterium sp.]|nr:zf-TFIIB domain-containing protein [Candidatus Calescibacterium sp.]MDW8132695.1 zf-TFIIB domain-containing protein [Candidatus Calescibacterium sp.]